MKTQENEIAQGRSPSYGTPPPTTGFLAGTVILTLRGEVPVEDLTSGDKIITRNCGVARLGEIDARTCRIRLVRIAAGSLGDTRPVDDMNLPSDHRILVRDWRAKALFGQTQSMTEVSALIDGEFITDQGEEELELFQLRFETPHIIYAGGIEVECAEPLTVPLHRAA